MLARDVAKVRLEVARDVRKEAYDRKVVEGVSNVVI